MKALGPLGTVTDIGLGHILVIGHVKDMAGAFGGVDHPLGGVTPGQTNAARLLAQGNLGLLLIPARLIGQQQGIAILIHAHLPGRREWPLRYPD